MCSSRRLVRSVGLVRLARRAWRRRARPSSHGECLEALAPGMVSQQMLKQSRRNRYKYNNKQLERSWLARSHTISIRIKNDFPTCDALPPLGPSRASGARNFVPSGIGRAGSLTRRCSLRRWSHWRPPPPCLCNKVVMLVERKVLYHVSELLLRAKWAWRMVKTSPPGQTPGGPASSSTSMAQFNRSRPVSPLPQPCVQLSLWIDGMVANGPGDLQLRFEHALRAPLYPRARRKTRSHLRVRLAAHEYEHARRRRDFDLCDYGAATLLEHNL